MLPSRLSGLYSSVSVATTVPVVGDVGKVAEVIVVDQRNWSQGKSSYIMSSQFGSSAMYSAKAAV